MRIDILTLFPKIFEGFLSESILGRAIKNDIIKVNLIDFREFSNSKHKKVDDSPYGGGAGMVLGVQSVYDALVNIDGYEKAYKILLTPQGKKFEQDIIDRFGDEAYPYRIHMSELPENSDLLFNPINNMSTRFF